MFIRHDKLNPKNCAVQCVRFVKSITRRPKAANIVLAGDNLIIEAKIHTFETRARRWRDNTESFESKPRCYGYCSSAHMSIFIKNEQMFHITKSGVKEFQNKWLLNHIMKNVFKEQV